MERRTKSDLARLASVSASATGGGFLVALAYSLLR